MSEALEFTGERFTPESLREIWYEHLHRYAFAAGLVDGLRVLDAACGEGYGAELLAQRAARVSAVDISEEAVQHARDRYAATAGKTIDFKCGDVTELPFEDNSFDAVVSFETLEHLQPQEKMLAEFRRVLKADGWLLISTPDRTEYNRHSAEPNPWHTRELEKAEFEALLDQRFPARQLLGQKLVFQSAIWAGDHPDRCHAQTWSQHRPDDASWPYAPVYWLALCAERADLLPEMTADLHLFGDRQESVYAHYYHEIRKNMQAGQLLADRDAEIQRLKAALQAKTRGPRPFWQSLWRRWF